MPYCKHCEEYLLSDTKIHDCKKVGLLDIDQDDSFIVSVIIDAATDSALLGGILGGDMFGDLFD